MNPLDQRIAIAESVGWRHRAGMRYHSHTSTVPETLIPDYLNDLNAMHEVEGAMVSSQWIDYEFHLGMVIMNQHGEAYLKYYINATAAQRAEAYLRTIRKWKD